MKRVITEYQGVFLSLERTEQGEPKIVVLRTAEVANISLTDFADRLIRMHISGGVECSNQKS